VDNGAVRPRTPFFTSRFLVFDLLSLLFFYLLSLPTVGSCYLPFAGAFFAGAFFAGAFFAGAFPFAADLTWAFLAVLPPADDGPSAHP